MRRFVAKSFSWVSLSLLLLAFFAAGNAVAQMTGEKGDGGRHSTPEAQSPVANKTIADENDEYRHSAVVAKLGSMVGLTTEQAATAFEVFNFLVLAVLIGGFLMKILPKTFRNRSSAIQKHLVDARTATEEATARMNSIEDRLAALDGQIADMRRQAEQDAEHEETRLKAALEEERGKILASADQDISAATMHAQRQLQVYAAELAIEQAVRKLVVSAETDRLLVQNFARRLASGGDGSGGVN
jgi:F-type H+-transporting ATPase subunit b